jgi:hypothetical protein
MKPNEADQRRKARYPIEAEAKVESVKGEQALRAITENLSECGVLLHFAGPTQLAIGSGEQNYSDASGHGAS